MKNLNKKIIIPFAILIIVIIIVGIIVITGKETNNSKIPKKCYKIGDTVSTDIAEFTLNDSKLTIALSNLSDETYYTPKKYDSEKDKMNPYVANTGHALVYVDFTLSAIDRTTIDVNGGSSTKNLVNILYKGETYSSNFKIGLEKRLIDNMYNTNGKWEEYTPSNILLTAGNKSQFRGYAYYELKTTNLEDTYYLIFNLPNSDGKTTPFTYIINP